MARSLASGLRRIIRSLGYDIVRRAPRPQWAEESSRYAYQRQYHDFALGPAARVLDIGSGAYPFPPATVLTDRYVEITEHRSEELVLDRRPFLISDTAALPFAERAFDFVYCSHVLEHVAQPLAVCAEIARVGRRGYIETPTLAKDMLFSWAQGMHRWHVTAIGGRLLFFEYSVRQLEGVRSDAWRQAVFAPYQHPIQDLYYQNPDLFNTMFAWEGGFICECFYLDGRAERARVGQPAPQP